MWPHVQEEEHVNRQNDEHLLTPIHNIHVEIVEHVQGMQIHAEYVAQ
jgi:hypothetical protein